MVTTPQIIFLDTEEADRALVAKHFPQATSVAGNLEGQELIATCEDAEIISTFITASFPRSVIEKLPKLRLLCTRSVGYDHIDIDACKEKGITVCNVPDYGSHVIAEHVFALLLATLRHIAEADTKVESGTFDYHGLRGMALKGKTLGILGTGKIGRKVARIAHGFEMKIIACDQCRTVDLEKDFGVEYVQFEELLRNSDILTLHVPATKETEHLFNSEAFAKMKNGVVLVNTARGSLIDSKALLASLKNKKIAYALLDVLEHEQNFIENEELISHPNVVTTPHIAFYADDSMRAMYEDSIASIEQWIAGKEPEHTIRHPNIICDLVPIKK
jgi:D-lactate dehydrogenase